MFSLGHLKNIYVKLNLIDSPAMSDRKWMEIHLSSVMESTGMEQSQPVLVGIVLHLEGEIKQFVSQYPLVCLLSH